MKRRMLPGTDLVLSDMCYGTGSFGGSVVGRQVDELINLYRDAGGNFLDTAHCYAFWLMPGGAGCSELAVADYIRRNGRGDLIIGTKGGHPGATGYRRVEQWLSPARIEADIDDSLARLDIEAIDLYWLHRDDTRMPVEQIIETLNHEISRGRIRWIGASNWYPERIAAANAYAHARGLRGFCASQPEWNLAVRNSRNPGIANDPSHGAATYYLEQADEAWYALNRFPVIPYTSTAAGFFASEGEKSKEAYDNPVTRARLAKAQDMARHLGVTTGQVALAWLLNQPLPVFPIIGPTQASHLSEDLGAADVSLSEEQVRALSA